MRKIVFAYILLLGGCIAASGQKPPTISKISQYRASIKEHPVKHMKELKKVIPSIKYDLVYATDHNFMKQAMYPKRTSITFLRSDAAAALQAIQNELGRKGLGLKIFDAYRPWSVSKKFWDMVQDERYVANPARGSNHNRGTAVDLTIIDLKTERELDMGTGFDNFTDTAHHDFKNLAPDILNNRNLLKTVMEANGFSAYNEEWWHYTFKTDIKFEVLDLPFKKLGRE